MPTSYDHPNEPFYDDDYPLPECQDGRKCYGDCDGCENPPECEDE